MSTYSIAGVLLFEAIALVTFILALRDAKDGWEDESGFHFAKVEQSRSADRVVASIVIRNGRAPMSADAVRGSRVRLGDLKRSGRVTLLHSG